MKKEIVKPKLTPALLRIILILSLILLVGAHVSATMFGQKLLQQSSKSVTDAVTLMQTTEKTLAQLQEAETILKTKKASIAASRQLVGQIKEYAYQKQIIYDAVDYGRRTNLNILGFTFTGNSIEASSPTTGADQAAQIPGVASHPVTVNLNSPANYIAVLHLLKYLEGNLTQIHLDNISLTSPSDENTESVEVPTLNLEVYTKQ